MPTFFLEGQAMLAKLIIVALLLAVVASLFSSAFFLIKDGSERKRVLTLLKVRVALSVSLVMFVLLSYHMGWIQPHGVHG